MAKSREDKLTEIKDHITGRRSFYYDSDEYKEFKKWYNAMHKQYFRIFDNTEAGQPRARNRVFFATIYTTVEIERAFLSELFFGDKSDMISIAPLPGTSEDVAWLNKQILLYYLGQRESNYKSTLESIINDSTLYGTGYDHNGWLFAPKFGRVNASEEDEFGFTPPPQFKSGITQIEDRPDIMHLEPLDVWYEPTQYDNNSRYRGYTYRVQKSEVKKWLKNPVYIQSEVKALLEDLEDKGITKGDKETGLDREFDYIQDSGEGVLVSQYYGDLQTGDNMWNEKKYLAFVAGDRVVRVQENPWVHGLDPITKYYLQKPNKVGYGLPPAIAVLPHSLWKNAMYNMKLDNVLASLAHQYIVNEDRLDPYEFFSPRFPGVISAQGDPTRAIHQLQMQDVSHGSFVDTARLIEEDIQKAGIPDQSAGLSGTAANETATGASIIESNANRKLNMESRKFSSCVGRSLNKMLQNIHEFGPDELIIKIGGKEQRISKRDIIGNVDVVIENRTNTNRQLRLERHMTALQLLAQATNVFGPQGLNQEFAGKIFESALKELDYGVEAENAIGRPSATLATPPAIGDTGQQAAGTPALSAGVEPTEG